MAYGMCFISGRWGIVEEHHIFGGARRKLSEKYGLKVLLSPELHRTGPEAAHRSAVTADILHRYGQRKVMVEQGWTVEECIYRLGRNYLDDRELEEVRELRREQVTKLPFYREERGSIEKTADGGFRIIVTVETLPY